MGLGLSAGDNLIQISLLLLGRFVRISDDVEVSNNRAFKEVINDNMVSRNADHLGEGALEIIDRVSVHKFCEISLDN